MRHAPALRFAVIGSAGFLVDLAALSAALWHSARPAAARPVLRHCRHVHLASQPALYLLLLRPSLGAGVGALRHRQFWRRRGQLRHIWSDCLALGAHLCPANRRRIRVDRRSWRQLSRLEVVGVQQWETRGRCRQQSQHGCAGKHRWQSLGESLPLNLFPQADQFHTRFQPPSQVRVLKSPLKSRLRTPLKDRVAEAQGSPRNFALPSP
jgi:hypothetical protein